MSAIWANDRINRHCVRLPREWGAQALTILRSEFLLRSHCLLRLFADELDALDQGMELVLSDVTLQ
jgi:hypothetical protein